MTYKERLAITSPEFIGDGYVGGCSGCPGDNDPTGPIHSVTRCKPGDDTCRDCWNQEIPGTIPHIIDSGTRREFGTGAVRDIQEGKGRCDLMPLDIIGELWPPKNNNNAIGLVFTAINDFQDSGNYMDLFTALALFDGFEDWPTMFLEVAKHFEEGTKKYGENNWQKGIPAHCYIDSAVRHYLKFLRGDTDEPHDRAFVWNLLCCMWTCKHKPELNDYARAEDI